MFQEFLGLFSFDHSILLDFLISSETDFLAYLWSYTSFLVEKWADYIISMERSEEEDEGEDEGYNWEEDEDTDTIETESGERTRTSWRTPRLTPSKVDETLSCLIRLKFALEGLVEKGLFPYNIAPLLKHLTVIEALYEDLEFEEEEGEVELHEKGFSLFL